MEQQQSHWPLPVTLRPVLEVLAQHVAGVNPDSGRRVSMDTLTGSKARAEKWAQQVTDGVVKPLEELLEEHRTALAAVERAAGRLETARPDNREERVQELDEALHTLAGAFDVEALGLARDTAGIVSE